MTGALGAAYRDPMSVQPASLGFSSLSNARSMANLQSQCSDNHSLMMDGGQQRQQQMQMPSSTSVGDLNTSEEDASGIRKPILKKDSKYGSRRELPALGVSGVVSKGRPSIFEFWENMLTNQQPAGDNSMTAVEVAINGDTLENAAAAAACSRSSMRRILPALPNQQSNSLTVYTSNGNGGGSSSSSEPASTSTQSDLALGSRGEVEGSSNQPSPTCVASENIDPNYWNNAMNNNNNNNNSIETPAIVKTVNHQHEMLVDELNRAKKQLALLQNMVSK